MRHNPYPPTPRSRVPIGLVAGAVLVVVLFAAGLVAIFWHEWIGFAAAYPLVANLLRFVAFAAPGSLGVGYAYTGLVIVWRRYADHRYIQAQHVERLTLAQRSQGLPTTVQSLSYHDSHKELPAPPHQRLLPEPVSAPVVSIPTFGQLLDQGQIGPNRPLILGYSAETGAVITGDWNQLFSCGIGGMTGSGKSWVIAFLAGQSAAAGARIILVDLQSTDAPQVVYVSPPAPAYAAPHAPVVNVPAEAAPTPAQQYQAASSERQQAIQQHLANEAIPTIAPMEMNAVNQEWARQQYQMEHP
jgi:hypothetical protein